MNDIGISFHMRGRMDATVTIDDAHGVADWGIFCAQYLFTLIACVDVGKLERMLAAHGGEDNTLDFIGGLGVALLDASLSLCEEIEQERIRLAALTPEKGGAQ
jgi:hypothetical protein